MPGRPQRGPLQDTPGTLQLDANGSPLSRQHTNTTANPSLRALCAVKELINAKVSLDLPIRLLLAAEDTILPHGCYVLKTQHSLVLHQLANQAAPHEPWMSLASI